MTKALEFGTSLLHLLGLGATSQATGTAGAALQEAHHFVITAAMAAAEVQQAAKATLRGLEHQA
jgi:hypothetical protein